MAPPVSSIAQLSTQLQPQAAAASINAAAIPNGSGSEIVYIAGVNFNSVVAGTSWNNWNFDRPATYNATTSNSFKWGSPVVGTAGGNVTYWFDAPSNWSVTEKNAFISGLSLWSAETNITFSIASSAATANVSFVRGSTGSAATSVSTNGAGVGTSTDGTPSSPVTITIDPSGGFGPLGASLDRKGGYPYDTIVHELGHMLGLGHGGAYNAGDGLGTIPDRQFSAYDNRLWTIMSYIEPTDKTATFYGSNPVSGTQWGDVQDTNGNWGVLDPVDNKVYAADPTTPMMLDILATQLIYGKAVSGPLSSGGQIFGFNCNIPGTATDGSIRRYFDFTINKHPIITIWDGGGNNTLDLSGWAKPEIINLTPGTFSSANGEKNNIGISGDTIIANAVGGLGADIITGNGVANVLRGGAGADRILGGSNFIADADTLQGGSGADFLDGQAGIDTADYSDSFAAVVVNLGSGIGSGGTASGDRLFNIENLNGSAFGDTLTGSSSSQTLWGNAGSDILIALNFATLYGGTGDDTYVVNNLNTVIEFANQGFDTVRSSVRWVLDANFEDLVLTGTANVNGFGNAQNNHLTGNNGNNYLQGFAGLDALVGGLGNDYYELGDLVFLGRFLGYFYDTVAEGAGAGIDTESITAIQNPLRFSTSGFTLGANIENGIIQGTIDFNLNGNDLDNILTGNRAANVMNGFGGNDTLLGGLGIDTLAGGIGNDAYYLDDTNSATIFSFFRYDSVTELAGQGTDWVFVNSDQFTSTITSFYTLGANIENARVTGSSNFFLTGNELNNSLNGNSAANTLTGLAGNDRLEGGLADDILVGGLGDDTYVLSDTNSALSFSFFHYDTVTEGVNGGIDTVYVDSDQFTSTITSFYTLGANVENGITAGTSRFLFTGNELNNNLVGNIAANTLTGLAGNDRLDGGLGIDQLVGGLGNDTYILNDTFKQKLLSPFQYDVVIEGAGGGNDNVWVSSQAASSTPRSPSYTLDVNIENGTITGAANFSLYGNGVSNVLNGNAAANNLVGFAGNDIIKGGLGVDNVIGGVGADQLYGEGGTDQFIFSALTESGTSTGFRDVIHDFAIGEKIDVSAIDANALLALNQSFALDTNGNFGIGEIGFQLSGADLIVRFNTDADAAAEMEFLVLNRASLNGLDFVL
jgi:Ca2+-binding RTX toxin-like protein